MSSPSTERGLHASGRNRRRRLITTSLLTIPNLISLARLPLALAFVLVHDTASRIVFVAAAAFSDWLDGWWARTRGPATAEGALIDPLTDKVFVVSALAGFVASGALTAAQLLVLLARDVFVAAGALIVLLFRLPVRLSARFPGKLLTNVQIAAVLVLLLAPRAAVPLVVVAAIVTAWAIADYAVYGMRSLRRPADGD